MNKRIRRLKGLLEPKSEFHKKQDEAELKKAVEEVDVIAAELPETVTASTQYELKTVLEMLRPRPAPLPAKVEKPELVIDYDDYETY